MFQILELLAAFFAAIMVMILHELPKSIIGAIGSKKAVVWGQAINVFRYIDPIGLLLSVVAYAGFSRPMLVRGRRQRSNLSLGIAGMLSLLVVGVMAVWVLHRVYGMERIEVSSVGARLIAGQLFWIYVAVLSVSMLVVNLFPVSVFDMGLIIAGISATRYWSIIKNDTVIKCILIFSIAVGVVRYISFQIVEWMLQVL